MEFTVRDSSSPEDKITYHDDVKYLCGHQYNYANAQLGKHDVGKIIASFDEGFYEGGLNEFIKSQGDPDFLIGIAACVFKPKGKAWKHDDYEKYKQDLGYADAKYLLHGLGFFLTLSPITPESFHSFLKEHLMITSEKSDLKKTG